MQRAKYFRTLEHTRFSYRIDLRSDSYFHFHFHDGIHYESENNNNEEKEEEEKKNQKHTKLQI